jgi:hypothetical protein
MAGTATADAAAPSPVEVGHLPPPWEPTPAQPRLPIGVAVVSVLIGLVGFIMVLAALLFVLSQVVGWVVPTSLEILPAVDVFAALILLIVGAALLAIATSLWHQETWALWTTIVLVFVMTAYLFFTGSISIIFVLFVALLVYLLAVRRYFY